MRERRFGEGSPLGSETRPASRRLEEGRGLFIFATQMSCPDCGDLLEQRAGKL